MLATLEKYPQWIELYNTTDQDVDLNGWRIVGRYIDDLGTVRILDAHLITLHNSIKAKETILLVSYTIPQYRNKVSDDLTNKIGTLQSTSNNCFNHNGLVLELQDSEGNPIDRIGNLNVNDEIVWEIPNIVRNKRVSLIRRLKSVRSQEYNFSFGMKKFGWFSAENVKDLLDSKSQYYYGSSTDIGTPGYRTESGELLPVTLSSFLPQLNKDGEITINWVTESEIDNAGFNILRSEFRQGPFVKVNPKLIQGAGTTGQRSFYSWTDSTAKPDVEYFYQLEDVTFSGERQTLSTKRIKGLVSAKNRMTTQWGRIKSRP